MRLLNAAFGTVLKLLENERFCEGENIKDYPIPPTLTNGSRQLSITLYIANRLVQSFNPKFIQTC
jgi:hypothetical protein